MKINNRKMINIQTAIVVKIYIKGLLILLPNKNRLHNCSSKSFAPHKTIGTPVPGWTEAPTKYKFLNILHLKLGLNHRTWKSEWANPSIDPFHKLNFFCQVLGSFTISCAIKLLKLVIFNLFSIVSITCSLDRFTSWSKSTLPSLVMCPVGTNTTTVSLPSGAAVGSMRLGTFT